MINRLGHINIEDTGLSVRSYNCLKRAGLNTIGDVMQKTDKELREIRNLGVKSLAEIKRELFDEERLIVSITDKISYLEAQLLPLADSIGEQEIDPEKIKKYKAIIRERDGLL